MNPSPRVVFAQAGRLSQLVQAAKRPPQRGSTRDEAFYPEERGAQYGIPQSPGNPYPLYKNKHFARLTDAVFENPLVDPKIVHKPVLEAAEAAKAKRESPHLYYAFVPKSFTGPLAQVSVFFNVGPEIIRHGLGSYFEGSKDKVLILVPGMEPPWTSLKKAWAVGITDSHIATLLARAGVGAWRVKTIACYSTGYRGFNESIEQLAANPLTRGAKTSLDLTHVETAIVYDAFYSGSRTKTSTEVALKSLRKLAPKARLVVYGATQGGAPRVGGNTEVPQATVKAIFGADYTFIELAKPELRSALLCLIYARLFQSAIADGYYKASDFSTELQTLISTLPKRGTFTSGVDPSFRAFPGKISLASWAAQYKAEIAAVLPTHANRLAPKVLADRLLGWDSPVTELQHDGLVPEFAHEFLLG